MIKLLKKYQVQSTPFNATKKWSLNNTENDNLLLTEDGIPYALEFLDYGDGSGLPVDNASCDIALEQQDANLAIVEEGLNVTGIFYPNSDPQNIDGTYKRSIYYQVKTMFYNLYLDPTKMWGSEDIDFELSETKRKLSDKFRLINIPRTVFGDKIIPNTVIAYDDSSDNEYTITDDGNGNLFAGTNIFAYQQELGYFSNSFDANSTSSYCNWYWQHGIESEVDISNLSVVFYTGSLVSQLRIDTASVSLGFFAGNVVNAPPYFNSITNSIAFYSASMQNVVTMVVVTGSLADIPTINLAFNTGFTTNTVPTVTSSFDSASTYLALYTGSILLTTFQQTASFDSASTYLALYTGSILLTTFPQTMSFNQITTSVVFYHGSLM
jgi:hypothetical protein